MERARLAGQFSKAALGAQPDRDDTEIPGSPRIKIKLIFRSFCSSGFNL
jgi:hypothetical protein